MAHPSMLTSLGMAVVVMVLLLGPPPFAQAGAIISGTRHIYLEKNREINIQITNDDLKAPRLIQAWLERGQAAELSDVPFSVSPPVFRIDPGKGQVIRLIYTREPLPADRESLFWLNVLDVPPNLLASADPEESQQSYLRFAFRIRTKVFFRPAKLPGTAQDATGHLRWSLQRGPQGVQLRVHNASAYHITFNEVALVLGTSQEATVLPGETGMVAPGDNLTLAVHRSNAALIPADAQVQFRTINDYGAFSAPQRAPLRF